MIVKEDKSLLSWLSRELEPLTMADPETLAEYVIALLKNDKEIDALIAFCVEQLYDFLKENTKGFVKDLFRVLKDESYINVKPIKHKEEEDADDDDDHKIDFNRRRRGDDDDDDDDRSSRRRSSNQEDEDNSSSFRNKRRKSDVPATVAVTGKSKTISTTSTSSSALSRAAAISAPLSSSQGRHNNNNRNITQGTSSSHQRDSNGSYNSSQKNTTTTHANHRDNNNNNNINNNRYGRDNMDRSNRGASVITTQQEQHDYVEHNPTYNEYDENANSYISPPHPTDFSNMNGYGVVGGQSIGNSMYPPLPLSMMMAGMPPNLYPTSLADGGLYPGGFQAGGFYSPYGMMTGMMNHMYGGGMLGNTSGSGAGGEDDHFLLQQQPPPSLSAPDGNLTGEEQHLQHEHLQHEDEQLRRTDMHTQPPLHIYHPSDEYQESIHYPQDDSVTPYPPLQPPVHHAHAPYSPPPIPPDAATMNVHNGGKAPLPAPFPPSQSPPSQQKKPVPPPRVPVAPPVVIHSSTSSSSSHPLPPPKPADSTGVLDASAGGSSISPPVPAMPVVPSWSTVGSMYPYYGGAAAVPGMAASMFNYSNMYGGGTYDNAAVAAMNATGGAYGTGIITAAVASVSSVPAASGSGSAAYDGGYTNTQSQNPVQSGRGGGGYRKHQQRGSGGGGGGYNGSGSHGGFTPKTNDLPESERCTLLCTGIPTYIKEEEIMHHFRTFGRVVQLQVTSSAADASSGTTAAAIAATSEASTSSSTTETTEKKTYNECLVQFSNSDEAKKCYSSPTAVLNNRFIRIAQSNFNIIPPADVPPATAEELLELQAIQQAANQTKFGSKISSTSVTTEGEGVGKTVSLQPRVPRSLASTRLLSPLATGTGKFVKNKKYIAGVTPDTPPVTVPVVNNTATSVVTTVASSTGSEEKADGRENDDTAHLANVTATTEHRKQPLVNETANALPESSSTSTAIVAATHTLIAPVVSSSSSQVSPRVVVVAPVPSAAQIKENGVVQQQYEDLRKLRTQVDNIWKTKQTLLQSQIDKCREMIATIEASPTADKMRDTVETIESKIVDLQSQLRVVQEQRATGTLQQPSQQQQQLAAAATSGRGYIRGGGRGGGRSSSFYAGRSNSYSAVATSGGRGGGGRMSMGGRWQQPAAAATGGRAVGGRGGLSTAGSGSTPAKNLAIDNRPRCLLISTAEWMKLPDSFTSKIEEHFSRFGEVKNMSSLPNGDLVIEFGTRREAEMAMNNAASYEGSTMKFEWYQSAQQIQQQQQMAAAAGGSSSQSSGKEKQQPTGGSDIGSSMNVDL